MPLALTFAALCSCGGSGGGPEPIEVPDGLKVNCESALDGGELPSDGTWREATLAETECLIYRFETVQDAQYTVQVLVQQHGNVDFIASSRADFTDLVTASLAFGDDPESASFGSEMGGTYHLALIGRAELSEASVRVLRNVDSPLGLDDCDATIEGGELTIGAEPRSDVLFPRTCVLYTFEGTADAVHRLTLTADGTGAAPEGMFVAADRDFTEIVDSTSFLEAATTRYFVTGETRIYHVVTIGEFGEASFYELAVARGDAPLGLNDLCFDAVDKGAVSKDWTEVTSSVASRECHIYTLSVAEALRYFVGPSDSGGDDLLRIAADAAFQNPVATIFDEVRGSGAKRFTAGATGTLHVAVMTYEGVTRDYSLQGLEAQPPPSGLEPWCNRARAEGALVAGAAASTSSVERGECAGYTLAVQAGITYSLSATAASGEVGLFVSSDAAHTQELASSTTSSPGQGLAFTAPSTGNVHIAVSGRGDVSSYSLRAVTTAPLPTGLDGRCAHAVNAGALTVGASATTGFAPDDQCMLYTFAGTSGTSYTVTVSGLAQEDQPDLVLATSATFTAIVDEEATPDDDTIVFTAPATQTFHLAVYAFQGAQYTIGVTLSPPPPVGLSAQCASARNGGAVVVDGAHVFDSAVQGQCALFSFAAGAGTSYTVTVFSIGGDPSLVVAANASFSPVLTTQATPGGQSYSFTATGTQSYHLAVFPADATTTNFEIFVTSP